MLLITGISRSTNGTSSRFEKAPAPTAGGLPPYDHVVSRWLIAALVVVGLFAVAFGAYVYGKHASCPPPRWWFKIFRQSGTYRCAG